MASIGWEKIQCSFTEVEYVKVPRKKEYVKYMQNYKSRALVDFDKGLITVETLDTKNSKESLKKSAQNLVIFLLNTLCWMVRLCR